MNLILLIWSIGVLVSIRFNKIFIHWYKDQSIDFDLYIEDVRNKKNKWEELGVIRKSIKKSIRKGCVVDIDIVVKSDKDNHFGFWSWYYKIPFNEDINVIGNMTNIKDIINSIPELFVEFIDKHKPEFIITFSEWIQSQEHLIKTIELFKTHKVS